MSGFPRAYGIVPADHLVQIGLATRSEVQAGSAVPIPSLAYGDQDLSGRELREQPGAASWRNPDRTAFVGPVGQFTFRNATVHSAEGIVTVGRYLVADTLQHVWPPRALSCRVDDGLWLFLHDYVGRRCGTAKHLLCGDPANYFHWLLDAVARWGTAPDGSGTLLLPGGGGGFQTEAAALLPGLAEQALYVGTGEAVEVEELTWIAGLTGAGLAFHPALLRMSDAMVAAAGARSGALPTQIFVSRRDSSHRRLRNEAELERLCGDRGFQTVQLAGMPLAHQIALFAGATRIVAPHGAGLANLLFCGKGTALLELHMDHYVNWCFRYLAGLRGLRYGCLVGRAHLPIRPDWVHGAEWTLDPAALAAALDDPRFAPDHLPEPSPGLSTHAAGVP